MIHDNRDNIMLCKVTSQPIKVRIMQPEIYN